MAFRDTDIDKLLIAGRIADADDRAVLEPADPNPGRGFADARCSAEPEGAPGRSAWRRFALLLGRSPRA